MTWDKTAGTIATGAIGIAVGIVAAGKVIKDITSIKTNDAGEFEMKRGWRI